MGDKIRLQIEGMLPEMLTFVKRRVFTKEEVNQIMKERENNEYLLERKNASAKDYLKVIEYEYGLEKQRRKRFKALKIKKETPKDFAIIRRIIQLWDKITYRNRYRVDIWKQYLSFCYFIESKKVFFKAITAALRFNPQCLDLWVLAAYYESDINGNPFKGRKIFYKALNQNSKTVSYWIQYFKYEVKFLEKVMTRQLVIMQDTDTQKENDAEATADFMAFEGEKKQSDILLQLDNINSEDLEQMLLVLKEVYQLALKNFQVTEFGFEFLQNLNEINGKWINSVKEIVINDIKTAIENENDTEKKDKYIGKLVLVQNNFQLANLSKADLVEQLGQLVEKVNEDNSLSSMRLAIFSYLLQILVENKQLVNPDTLKYIKNASNLINIISSEEFISKYPLLLSQFVIEYSINNQKEILDNLQKQISIQEEKTEDNNTIEAKAKKNLLETIFSYKIDILVMQGGQENAIKYIRLKLQNQKDNSAEKRFSLLKKYFEIKMQIKEQFKEINQQAFFNLCHEQLILQKEYFEKLIIPFFDYLNKNNYSGQVQLFMKKLISFKQQCPLSVYLQYISLFEKVQSKKNEISQLWVYISQWYQNELSMWEAYFKWQRDFGDIKLCPTLLERLFLL